MDTPINHILVPVDYSDKSIYGIKTVANLIKNQNSKVTFINVLKGVDPIWTDFFSDEERSFLLEKLKKHLSQFVNKQAEFDKEGVEFRIIKGKLCETILETAEEINASMIVMGTSTVDNIKKWIIGTNALRVVSESNCPVLTVKQEPLKNKIERIILPLDVTKETREKTKEAVALAAIYGASISVVCAYTLSDEFILNKLQAQMNQVLEYIESHKVACEGELIKVSDRVDGVLEFVDTKKGDLIVITTHQQLEIVKPFMGSFAKGIIRGASIPVLSTVPIINHHLVFKMPAT